MSVDKIEVRGRMMKKMKKYLFVFIIITGTNLFAGAPDTLWTRTYGGTNGDDGYSVQQTSDRGYIIGGYDGTGLHIWLIKTDSLGNKLWDKHYGNLSSQGSSVRQTEDRGYIIAGEIRDSSNYWDILLIKTDSIGDTIWTKTYGGNKDDMAYSTIQTKDGGYIITGATNSYTAGTGQVWLIKTDKNGDTLWTRTFGGGGVAGDDGYSVQQTNDDGYIIAGRKCSSVAIAASVWIIKTDSLGNHQWNRTFGGTDIDIGLSVQQTYDKGYIVTGYTNSFGAGYEDVWLIKTDSSGNKQWDKTFGGTGNEEGESVLQTLDGGYIVVGWNGSFTGAAKGWLIRTDSLGDTLWTKICGGSSCDDFHSIQLTSDSGYIIVGATSSYGAGQGDIWLVRIGVDRGIGIEEPSISDFGLGIADLKIRQNPFSKSTIISYSVPEYTNTCLPSRQALLTLYDLTGSCVKTLINEQKPAGTYTTILNANELKTGIYFLTLTNGNFKTTRKLTILK